MLSLGGVASPDRRRQGRGPRHLRRAARRSATASAVELAIDGGSTVVVQAGARARRRRHPRAPDARRLRLGHHRHVRGAVAGLVDEVVVVDDHITGVVSEHQAGKVLGWQPTGIRIKGHRSTPGRYFRVSEPGQGWGGTRLDRPARDPRPLRGRRRARAPASRCSWSRPPASSTPTTCSTTTSSRSRSPCPPALAAHRRAHRRELRALALHRALHRRRRRLAARRRHRRTRCG